MNALLHEVSLPRVLCREITTDDTPGVIDLLTRGFSSGREFWRRAFASMKAHDTPSGLPRYGYLLECRRRPVGVLLTINSTTIEDGSVRCNFSSWYVEPEYRAFAAMLVSRALRRKDVTYLNLTPAPATVAILKAQGYKQLFSGRAFAFPVLRSPPAGARVLPVESRKFDPAGLSADEERLLRRHASFGCISVVCRIGSRAYPFVFSRRVMNRAVPVALLVYCRGIEEFVLCAGALGRHLAKRGVAAVSILSNGPTEGVPGFHLANRPTFFIGPAPPKEGDLAYTECAMFHV